MRPPSADMVIDDSNLSRFHAELQRDPKKGWSDAGREGATA